MLHVSYNDFKIDISLCLDSHLIFYSVICEIYFHKVREQDQDNKIYMFSISVFITKGGGATRPFDFVLC